MFSKSISKCLIVKKYRKYYLHTSYSQLAWTNKLIDSANTNHSNTSSYLTKILNSRVYEVADETKTSYAATLSSLLNNHIYLKREDTQPVFSFKIRGAYNKIASLSKEQLEKGVVTCSAGNHAQGVALSSSKLKIKAAIVMPEMTPMIKVNAVKRFGGSYVDVILHGKNYDEAAAEASRLVIEKGLTMVHPFDDPFVIAGQGTIAMEIMKCLQGKEVDYIFVCVGGGGMLAGIAAYIKAVNPEVKVIGVEADDAAGMTESLIAGKVITLPSVGLFADGAAVRTVGQETFRICHALVDGMVTVKTDEICSAIKMCFNDTRCILEPAGALGIAGMVKFVQSNHIVGKTMVAITSGANMDFDRLRFVSERADSSETLMSVSIPEKPGSFREFYSIIYPRNVTEFSYRWNNLNNANVVVSLQTLRGYNTEEDKELILKTLTNKGYIVHDLSENELAKSHIRHLAGGRPGAAFLLDNTSNNSNNDRSNNNNSQQSEKPHIECIYRFEFPESPGALGKFLFTLTDSNQDWSISLFHYRNHGHDYGRVLVGLLLKDNSNEEKHKLHVFLNKLAYKYYDETNNPAFTRFLK